MTKNDKIQEAIDRNAAIQEKLESLLKEVNGNLTKAKSKDSK